MPASIQSVYAEKGGFVWVSTRKGLGRFDGYELKLYTHDAGDPYSLPGNEVYQVVEDSLRKLEYDLYYIKNISILLDITIFLKTIGVVLFPKGAR